MTGTHVSYWSKIAGPIVAVGLIVLSAIFKWSLPWQGAVACGAFVFIVGLPIDASIWIDKLSGIARARLSTPTTTSTTSGGS